MNMSTLPAPGLAQAVLVLGPKGFPMLLPIHKACVRSLQRLTVAGLRHGRHCLIATPRAAAGLV